MSEDSAANVVAVNMDKRISNLRELIAYSSEDSTDDTQEQCIDILDAYQDSQEDENAIWPEDALLDYATTEELLTALPEDLHYKAMERESTTQLRLRMLRNRVKLEDTKRELRAKFKEVYPEGNATLFDEAIEYGDVAHTGQFRDSGELYFLHPLEVTMIILDMGMDMDAIIAGLLHDVVEDTDITLDEITEKFGAGVAGIVNGVTKLTRAGETNKAIITKEQQQAESVRKMFLAMAKDIRVIPVKLADRLHNMRTLAYCHSDKRVRKAQETLEIYAPLAHRLGMGQVKCELEDLSFMQINPVSYEEIKSEVQTLKIERESFLQTATKRIEEALEENNIKGSIHGRPKHLYSIYKKLQKNNCTFEEVYDLMALRVIVDSVADCYNALGIVHSLWRPLPGRMKDYVATPKPNGYRSLHTTLIGENGVPFEVQIRTEEMHKMAEYGIAAHWKYKEGRAASSSLDLMLDWMRQLMDDSIEDSDEFMRVLKVDFFSDYVFVFTPEGDIADLVVGSTPLDFAYRIHSEVGNQCIGAKVNGRIVPLSYELQTGDIVEIITSASSIGPKRDWLNVVKTQHARNKIRNWFRTELKDDNIEAGKTLLEKEARRHGYALSDLVDDEKVPVLFKKLSLNNMQDMYAAVGYGSVAVSQIVPRLLDEHKKADKEAEQVRMLEELTQKKAKKALQKKLPDNAIIVKGESGMLVRLARCCSPVPGDKIVGYITRGRGVSVHKSDCKNLEGMQDGNVRFIDVEWANAQKVQGNFRVFIHVEAMERTGLMMDITKLFMNMNIGLTGINAKTDVELITHITLEFEVRDSEQLTYIINQINQIPSVTSVYRTQV